MEQVANNTFIELLTSVGIPVFTALIGWFGAIYRTRQKKQADILDNMNDIIDQQRQYIERQQKTIERVDEKLERIGIKVDAKKKAIRKAYGCDYYRQGNDCPVLIEDDKNEDERMRVACEQCPHNDDDEN